MADGYTLGDPHDAYLAGCTHKELVFARCSVCGNAQLPAFRVCRACGGTVTEVVSEGRGQVASFTVIHRAASPHFKGVVPFVLALIDLDEGFRAMMHLRGALEPRIGERVSVTFVADGRDGAFLPCAEREKARP